MNVSKGDLAVIVSGPNQGHIVEVVEYVGQRFGMADCWLVTCKSELRAASFFLGAIVYTLTNDGVVPDAALRRIGGPGLFDDAPVDVDLTAA